MKKINLDEERKEFTSALLWLYSILQCAKNGSKTEMKRAINEGLEYVEEQIKRITGVAK